MKYYYLHSGALTLLFILISSHFMTAQSILDVEGPVEISTLSSAEDGQVIATANGELEKVPRSKFKYSQWHNTGNPTLNNSTWTPIGQAMTFIKDSDATILDCQFRGMTQFYGTTGTAANWLSIRVQVIGQTAKFHSEGNSQRNVLWEFISARSVYEDLPSGTYTIRLQAKTNNSAAEVFLHSNASIVVEERF